MNDWLLNNLLRLIYDLSKQDTMQRIDVENLGENLGSVSQNGSNLTIEKIEHADGRSRFPGFP